MTAFARLIEVKENKPPIKYMKPCFVIMPIGSGEAYEVYLNRYLNIIKPAVESVTRSGGHAYDSVRADFISSTGSINRTVLEHLYNADVVIADLTDLNPNVFYELGVRHSLRNGTILLALKGTKLPFDISDLKVIFYEDKVGGEKDVIPKIRQLLEVLLTNRSQDSPVFLALPQLQNPTTRDLSEAQARVSSLQNEARELRVKLSVAEQTNLNLRESFAKFEDTVKSAIERSNVSDARTVDLALENASRKQEKPSRRVPDITKSEEDPNSMFVLMPFRKEFEGVYGVIKRVGTKLGIRVFRADEMVSPGQITDQILEAINKSGIILADLTHKNPNVLYEIGIAHTLGKKTILITQDSGDIPFDLGYLRFIVYENTVTGAEQLEESLLSYLKYLQEEIDKGG